MQEFPALVKFILGLEITSRMIEELNGELNPTKVWFYV